MDYKDSAKLVYRKLVSSMVRDLVTFPNDLSLTRVASVLHLTICQMSRIYHGSCSLSPERFLVLQALYCTMVGKSPFDPFYYACKNVSSLPNYGLD